MVRPASCAAEARHSLPPTRQSPYPSRHQFHRIPGRVTKVNGLAAFGPLDLFFNRDAVALQKLPPGVEYFSFDAQGEMARPGGSMRRQQAALDCSFGPESKQDIGRTHLKENV